MVTDNLELKKKLAAFAGSAAWHLGHWNKMEEYINLLPEHSFDGSYYRAILATWQGIEEAAQGHINQARGLLGDELRAMISESYSRAYRMLVRGQQLTEIEEVLDYKRAERDGDKDRKEAIQEAWTKRVNGMQR
jgi:serine/threonine-protein kinase mTOR